MPDTSDLVKVYKCGTGQISQLVKNNGDLVDKTGAYSYLKIMFVLLNKFFGTKWDDDQLRQIAEIFYSQYWYWHLLDLKVFSTRIMSGQYTSNKNYAPVILMEYALAYDNERVRKIVEDNDVAHASLKHDADRQYELTRQQLNSIENKTADKDRIKRMQDIIDGQKKRIEQNIFIQESGII